MARVLLLALLPLIRTAVPDFDEDLASKVLLR